MPKSKKTLELFPQADPSPDWKRRQVLNAVQGRERAQENKSKKCLISRRVTAVLQKISSEDLEDVLRWLRGDASISAKHVAMATKRLRSLARVAEKVSFGESIHTAVRAENLGMSTFYRSLWDWDREGASGLIPSYANCGRVFEPVRGNALAGWKISEADVLAASIAEAFRIRRGVAMSKLEGSPQKRESSVNAMLRAMEIEKAPLAWGIATMVLRSIHSPASLLRVKGCPIALRLNLKSQTGDHTWKFMLRKADQIRTSKLF